MTRWSRGLVAAFVAAGCGSFDGDALSPSPARTPRRESPNQTSLLGYNLDFPGDWTDMPPFIDLMQNSRVPEGKCSEDDPECSGRSHLDLAPDGWPRSLRYRDDSSQSYASIGIVISSGSHRSDFGQRFIVTWEGSGKLEVDNGQEVRSVQGAKRISFTLQPDATYLRLTEIDPDRRGDYLRNIRVFRADQEQLLEQGEVFNPEMLDFLAPFRSLRFMDWMASNEYGVCSGGQHAGDDCYAVTDDDCGGGRCVMPGHWNERPDESVPSRLSSGQYLDLKRPELGTRVGGYPLETLVALANRVPADPHFNLPVDADDEYVKNFAETLKKNLDPRLVASVEYGNEVWNWGFPQAEYANQKGQKLWPDEGSAWVQYSGSRMQHLCGLWKEVFKEHPERVRCLIAPQTGWPEMSEAMLDCPAWAGKHPDLGPCHQGADAIAITGYFSGCLQQKQNESKLRAWLAKGKSYALDQFFEQLENGDLLQCSEEGAKNSLVDTLRLYQKYAFMARARGLDLYVYESGTHFDYDGKDQSVEGLFVAAAHDERMAQLYRRNLEGYKEAGGTIINAWGWVGPNDSWANTDNLKDLSHPKYRALRDFAQREPCWWERCDRSQR